MRGLLELVLPVLVLCATAPTARGNDADYSNWTPARVGEWLGTVGLAKLAPSFIASEITGEMLHDLDEETLKEDLGVTKKLDRIKFLRHRKRIGRGAPKGEAGQSTAKAKKRTSRAETAAKPRKPVAPAKPTPPPAPTTTVTRTTVTRTTRTTTRYVRTARTTTTTTILPAHLHHDHLLAQGRMADVADGTHKKVDAKDPALLKLIKDTGLREEKAARLYAAASHDYGQSINKFRMLMNNIKRGHLNHLKFFPSEEAYKKAAATSFDKKPAAASHGSKARAAILDKGAAAAYDIKAAAVSVDKRAADAPSDRKANDAGEDS